MESAFAKSAGSVLSAFKVDADAGLTEEMVVELRTKHGRNGVYLRPLSGDPAMGAAC